MGQKKIKTIDLSNTEQQKGLKTQKDKPQSTQKKFSELSVAKKTSKGHKQSAAGEKPDGPAVAKAMADKEKPATQKKTLKDKKARKVKVRSKRYKTLKLKVDRNKLYEPEKAIDLLISLANSKIDETVEIHINTKDKLAGSVNLPHGTGKKQTIAIVNDTLLAQITKGKINFDVLIATPKDMPKIAKVAKILGPKGLMPNPKAGTISDKPELVKKKLEAGEIRFKTEPKASLLHMTIGKISFGSKKLLENLKALIQAVQIKNILKAVLTSTQSPGIKLDLKELS